MHIKTNFWKVKQSKQHLLAHVVLWNAEDLTHCIPGLVLSYQLDQIVPGPNQASHWLKQLLITLKKFKPIISNQMCVSGLLHNEKISLYLHLGHHFQSHFKEILSQTAIIRLTPSPYKAHSIPQYLKPVLGLAEN
jgi:hypothetical protein